MSYQTLLAVHSGEDPTSSLNPAIKLAKSMDAQLDVLVINLATMIPTMLFAENPEYNWSGDFQHQLDESADREAEVRTYLSEHFPDASVSADCTQLGLIDQTVAHRAIYADLVLYSGGRASFTDGMMGHALSGALFDAGRPALLLPEGIDTIPSSADKIVIAWDEAAQSARAVTAALPLLRRARVVELLAISSSDGETGAIRRLDRLQRWLTRHDIDANPRVVPCEGRYVSHALVQTINEGDADVLVMGAYGHMRIRERLFSGVTHEALSEVQVPLLLAH